MAQNQQLGTFGQYVTVNAAANTITLTSNLVIGNSELSSTGLHVTGGYINSVHYAGTANNADNLGGVAAASYVNTAGSYTITGIHTYNANIVIGTAGISANGGFGSDGQSLLSNGAGVYWATAGATLNANNTDTQTFYIGLSNASTGAWTNAVVSTSGLSYVPSTKTLTVGNTILTTTINAATFSVGTTWSANSTRVVIGSGVALEANGTIGSAGQSLVSNGSSVYWTTAGATLNANNTDTGTYYIGLSTATTGSWTNAVVATSGLYFIPSTGTLTVANTVVATNFTGTANVATYLGNSSATVANVSSWITSNAGSAYTNAAAYTDASIGTANSAITGNAATAYTNAVSYTDGKIGTANAAITGNAATAYTNSVAYVDGLKLDSVTNTSVSYIPVANTVKNAYDRAIDANTRAASAQTAAAAAYTNAAAYTDASIGTANAAITGNASTAYTNAVSYTDTKIGTANAAITGNAATAYTNAVSYTDGKILTANAAITGNAATAYTNATTFAANASNISSGTLAEARLPYRMNQNLTSSNNVTFGSLTLTGNLTVSGNVTVIGANALSIVDNMIYLNSNNTTQNIDVGVVANYNSGGYAHTGIFRDASDGYWKVFDNYLPEPDSNVNIDTTNTSFHLADFQANSFYAGNTSTNWFTANTSGVFVNSTLIGNATGAYGKTEGNLNVNNALTSNNSSYLGGTAAAGYQTTAGLSANVATLTSNNSTYSYGKTEGNLNVNSALTSNNSSYLGGTAAAGYQTTSGLSTAVAALTSNNSTYSYGKTEGNLNVNSALTSNNSSNFNGQAAAYYTNASNMSSGTLPNARLSSAVVNTSAAFTMSGAVTFNANVTVGTSARLIANGAMGINGQILTSNGTTVYWANAAAGGGVDANTAYVWNNTHTFNSTLKANGTVDIASANVLNQTLTDAATIAWNTASGQVATVTLGASRTMGAPTNLKVGTYILHVIQGGSGSYGITWNGVFKWPAGVAPVLSTAVGARDIFSFISDGTNLYGSYLTDVK